LLERQAKLEPQQRARFETLDEQARRTLAGGIEKVAASRSKKAVPAAASEAWPAPVIYEDRVETINRSVPEIVYQTRTRTAYRTQTVPATRTITERVPEVQMQWQYRSTQSNGQRSWARVQVPVTVMTTRTRQVVENVTRMVPVTVTEQVPVTTTRTVAETRVRREARERRKYRVTLNPMPSGGWFYYLPDLLFDGFLGRRGKDGDNPDGWNAEWASILGDPKSVELWENVPYSLRGYWNSGGDYRHDNFYLTADTIIPVAPDAATK
jgi:hypothetical protein